MGMLSSKSDYTHASGLTLDGRGHSPRKMGGQVSSRVQGRRKQFNSGQAISQKGGSGGPLPENFGKMLLAGAFWYYLKST